MFNITCSPTSAFSRSQYSLSWAWDPSPTRPSAHRVRWPSPSSLPTKSSPNTSAFRKLRSSSPPTPHALHLAFLSLFLVADLHIDNTTVLCLRTAERGEAARCVSKSPSTGMSTRRSRSRPRLVEMRCEKRIFSRFYFILLFDLHCTLRSQWDIYMDSMAFGMGMCCLQATFQCEDINVQLTLLS